MLGIPAAGQVSLTELPRVFLMHHPTRQRSQRTLRRPVSITGVGYWSGRENRVELEPAVAGAGVVFVRGDIEPPMVIPVGMDFHVDAINRTNLSAGGLTVQMVEHVLSALAGLGVDCCRVVVSSEEWESVACDMVIED